MADFDRAILNRRVAMAADAVTDGDELRGLFARLVGIQDPSRVAIQPGVS
ncbi:MAG: hypothetical protein IH924_09230, partial [Proteobacteria bacterium]|nr:hypothetical protein [Pseudomonadota bacterium]